MRAVDSVLHGAAWRGLRALAPAMAAPMVSSGPAAVGPAAVPRVPYGMRGLTLVFDPVAARYVVDSTRAGAPVNGVRFVLYDTDAAGRPVVARETGYAEITDEGDGLPDGVALRLQVVTGGSRRLDYSVRTVHADSSGLVVAGGVFGDSSDGLRFEVGLAAVHAAADSVSVRFAFALPAHHFAAAGTMRNVAGGEGTIGEAAVAVRPGSDLIELHARGDGAATEAVVSVNGRLFARVVGEPGHVVVHGEGGRPLADEERRGLGAIMDLIGGVIGVAHGLFQPAGLLLGGA